VTFPQALFGAASKATADKHAKKNLPSTTTNAEDESPAHKTVALATVPAPSAPATESKSAATKTAARAESPEAPVAEKSDAPVPSKTKPAEVKEAKPAVIPTVAAAGDSKSKGRYALQLSSFQDKSEAETFAQKFEGERPYMVVSEIPGKGTWYRVRVGDYASAKDALAAKQSFERKHSVIAYVAQK
jgi:septal ring-binding cell division protein DamX